MILDNEMITRMLHLPPDKNKLLLEREDSSVKECTPEFKIYIDQICKDTDLYPMTSRTCPRGMAQEHFMPFNPDGYGPNQTN